MRNVRMLSFVAAAFFVLLGAVGVTDGPVAAQTVPPTTVPTTSPPTTTAPATSTTLLVPSTTTTLLIPTTLAPVPQDGTGPVLDELDLPTVSGTAKVGEPLQADPGTWTGADPITYTYRWQHCEDDCTDIPGVGTGPTYTPVFADIGQMIGFVVTATDVNGLSGPPASADTWSDEIEGIPPTGPAPVITGVARVGETLTATIGPWDGQGPLTTTWSWGRIESLEAQSGDEIEGATSNTYTLTAADLGMIVVAAVQVTGPLGTGYASTPSAPVAAALAPPTAGGASRVTSTGNTITVSGSGFAPNSDVTVVLRSDPVTLGVVRTDATGSFIATFPLPAGVTPGVHTLVFTGIDANGNPVTVEQQVTIAVAGASTLPVTGSGALPLTLTAVGLILAGTMSVRAGRRRAAPTA